MVRSSAKAIETTQSPILDWIEARPGEMHCHRCGCSAQLARVGEFDDGIPRIVLPHAWFALHSDPEHVPGDRSDPAPAPEMAPEPAEHPSLHQVYDHQNSAASATPTAVPAAPPEPPAPPPPAPRVSRPDPAKLSPRQAFLFATEPVANDSSAFPKVIPITRQEAGILCGRDACELLCGADRAEVLRHRRAVLAGTEKRKDEPVCRPSAPWQVTQPVEEKQFPERAPIDPSWRTLPHNTYVNVSSAVAWIRFPRRFAPVAIATHASVWLFQETFDMQAAGVKELFARATTVPAMLEAGAIEMTDRLRLSLERCGMLAPGAGQ